jgi:hypothetical protein
VIYSRTPLIASREQPVDSHRPGALDTVIVGLVLLTIATITLPSLICQVLIAAVLLLSATKTDRRRTRKADEEGEGRDGGREEGRDSGKKTLI